MSDLKDMISEFMRRHNTVTLATLGPAGPWAAAVFYVHDATLTLFFLSDPETRHGRDLATQGVVAGEIHGDDRDWRTIRGVQLEGRAELVKSPMELARGWQLYLTKFPFVSEFIQAPGEFVGACAAGMAKVRLYKLVPSRIWYTDNERHFGKRDVLNCESGLELWAVAA